MQLLVVEAPPCRRVAAEGLAGIAGIGRRPGLHVDDAHFEDVAGLGVPDEDRPGADVDAEALARAAAQQLAVDRTGAAPVDALLVLGPEEHAFRARVALDHALGVVVGVMGERLDGDVVAAVDLDDRLQELAEIAPMNGLGRRRNIVMAGLALPRDGGLGRRRGDQGAAGRDQRRRAAAGHEGALQETAPLVVEFLEQLPAMEFEIRTILVIASAHRTIPPCCVGPRRNASNPHANRWLQICLSGRRICLFGGPRRISAFSAFSANGFVERRGRAPLGWDGKTPGRWVVIMI